MEEEAILSGGKSRYFILCEHILLPLTLTPAIIATDTQVTSFSKQYLLKSYPPFKSHVIVYPRSCHWRGVFIHPRSAQWAAVVLLELCLSFQVKSSFVAQQSTSISRLPCLPFGTQGTFIAQLFISSLFSRELTFTQSAINACRIKCLFSRQSSYVIHQVCA